MLDQLRKTADTPEKIMALDNCICLFITGSQLYGTNTPASDIDYEGVFIEPPEYVLGSLNCDEINFSTGDHNTKNTSEDIDCKLYSLRKYIQLAQSNNPNKVEFFFIPEEKFIFKDATYWDQIVNNKDLFLSLKLKHSFSGYAHSQRRKLISKKKRYDELKSFRKTIAKGLEKGATKVWEFVKVLDLVEIHHYKKYHKDTDTVGIHKTKKLKDKYDYIKWKTTEEGTDSIVVDSKEYNMGMDLKKIYKYVDGEFRKYGQRTTYIKEHGYDLKFAVHIFRLYFEGLRLLEKGNLIFPMPEEERKFMIEIKNGEYNLDFLINKTNEMEPLFEKAYKENKAGLRYAPDQHAIHKLQIDIMLSYWKHKNYLDNYL